MSNYCNRYLDDAPGIRSDCERHLKARKRCEDCPHRDTHREVVDLRNLAADLTKVVEDFMPNVGRCVLQDYKRLNDSMVQAREHGFTVKSTGA